MGKSPVSIILIPSCGVTVANLSQVEASLMPRFSATLLILLALAAVAGVSSHAATLPLIGTQIDSHAQFALFDLVAKGGTQAREAVQIAAAVRTGRLGGIYLSNQGVPAFRAQDWGTTWWKLLPKGVDAVVLPPVKSKSSQKPIIVLRNSIASSPVQRNAALLDGWRAYALLDANLLKPCNGGELWVRQVAGAKHCFPPRPLPSSVKPPKSLFMSDLTLLSGWDKDYGVDPKCHRVNTPYLKCKAEIGKNPNLPAIVPASTIEGKSAVAPPVLTEAMLLKIMAPAFLPSKAIGKWKVRRDLQISRVKQSLPFLREVFELFKLDTARSRAHFLAHYGGELGGFPSLFGLREVGAEKAFYAPFFGRGPVQVTHRGNYVLSLAYTEKRAEMASVEAAQHFQTLSTIIDGILKGGTITIADLSQVEVAGRKHEQALREWAKLIHTTESIRGDKTQAEKFAHGFLFSGAYWHAALCPQKIRPLGPVTTTVHFIGKNAGAVCISGGKSSASGNQRAIVKSKIYNLAAAEFGFKASPSSSGKTKPKFRLKKKSQKKPRIKPRFRFTPRQ